MSRRSSRIVLGSVGGVVTHHEPTGTVVQEAHLAIRVPGGDQLTLRAVCRRVIVLFLVLVPVDDIAGRRDLETGGRNRRARCGGSVCSGRSSGASGEEQTRCYGERYAVPILETAQTLER